MVTWHSKIPPLICLLFISHATLSGCATSSALKEPGSFIAPYAGSKHDLEVALDVGAMRYQKYSDECPAVVGWLALADLPASFVADTVLLPFALKNRRNSHAEKNALSSSDPKCSTSGMDD